MRTAAAGCLLLSAALAALPGWGTAAWWAPVLLAAATVAADRAVVQLPVHGVRWTLTPAPAVVACGLVAAPGAWVVVGATAGAVLGAWLRSQPRLQLQYGAGRVALATAGAAAVAAAVGAVVGPGVPGATAGLAVAWLLDHLLTGLAVALTSPRRFRTLVASGALRSCGQYAGSGAVGLLAAHLALHSPLGLPGLLVPLALLWASQRSSAEGAAQVRLFTELAQGTPRAAVRSTDASAAVLLTAAARLFGGADVEMVLLAPEGPVRYAGDENGAPQRLRVDPRAFDEPWVRRALASRSVCSGTTDGLPWCSALVGPHDAPLAVLHAVRGRGAAAFSREETRLAEVLVVEAQSWLGGAELHARHSSAARALGDLGADTAPALTLLRDSADRLSRLSVGEGGLEQVVEELHLVERAVASLLGAVALAAEPDLLLPPSAVPVPRPPVRAAEEWTTTGVFG